MSHQKFLLCIGIPKAGTTWLYKVLQAHPSVNLGHKKEYHVFDTYFYSGLSSYRASIPEEKGASNTFYEKYLIEKKFDKDLQENHVRYGQYFSDILKNSNISITGDFTPTYCVLGDAEFKYIKSLTDQYGLDTHIIYLMRDPVSALLSYVKMAFRFKRYHGQVISPDLSANDLLTIIFNSQLCQDLSDYQKTINALLNNYEKSKLYFGIYEMMHTNHELSRLSDFLGVTIDPIWADKRVNANLEDHLEFDPALINEIKIKFMNQFMFCRDFFNQQDLATVWKYYS